MPGRIAIESAVKRRQPLLADTVTSSTLTNHRVDAKNYGINGRGSRMGEMAGECAAVCCCCPCALMHLLVLAVYRLPTGLCKKAWRRKKRQTRLLKGKRKKSFEKKESNSIVQWKTNSFGLYTDVYCQDSQSTDVEDYGWKDDAVEWDSVFGAGFWRSASRRDDQ